MRQEYKYCSCYDELVLNKIHFRLTVEKQDYRTWKGRHNHNKTKKQQDDLHSVNIFRHW